jgi:hypothetical protein
MGNEKPLSLVDIIGAEKGEPKALPSVTPRMLIDMLSKISDLDKPIRFDSFDADFENKDYEWVSYWEFSKVKFNKKNDVVELYGFHDLWRVDINFYYDSKGVLKGEY